MSNLEMNEERPFLNDFSILPLSLINFFVMLLIKYK